MTPNPGEVALMAKLGARSFWRMPRPDRLFLVFGAETRGLPKDILAAYPEQTYHIPITGDIRSLNLSTAVGIALYESLRNAGPTHGWGNGTPDGRPPTQ